MAPLEMNTEPNLHDADEILLRRIQNGWIVSNKGRDSIERERFVFESTESLQKNLVRLLGRTRGWEVQKHPLPARDDKGHFLKTP